MLQELAKLVPDYMVPAKIIGMRKLPKNANGKVNRQHLRALLDQ